jgi:hypothetical protein
VEQLPTLIIRRRQRTGPNYDARSWLGGLPRLGAATWPQDEKGAAPWFFAQIDCTDLNAALGAGLFPEKGALAFFIGAGGRVIYVPNPVGAETPLPANLPSTEEVGCEAVVDPNAKFGPRTFPHWPIEFVALPPAPPRDRAPDDGDPWDYAESLLVSEMKARFFQRQYNFDPFAEATANGIELYPHWRAALMYAERLSTMFGAFDRAEAHARQTIVTVEARLAALRRGGPPPAGQGPFGKPDIEETRGEGFLRNAHAQLDRMKTEGPALRAFVAHAQARVPAHDPWSNIASSDQSMLDELLAPARKEFRAYAPYLPHGGWRDYARATLLEMLGAADTIYRRLPEAFRKLVDEKCLLPIAGARHQMFGAPMVIQSNAALENEHAHLLLQLAYDDMMFWSFGDNGAYQFWINPKDLAAGRWEKVRLTFECH